MVNPCTITINYLSEAGLASVATCTYPHVQPGAGSLFNSDFKRPNQLCVRPEGGPGLGTRLVLTVCQHRQCQAAFLP